MTDKTKQFLDEYNKSPKECLNCKDLILFKIVSHHAMIEKGLLV